MRSCAMTYKHSLNSGIQLTVPEDDTLAVVHNVSVTPSPWHGGKIGLPAKGNSRSLDQNVGSQSPNCELPMLEVMQPVTDFAAKGHGGVAERVAAAIISQECG